MYASTAEIYSQGVNWNNFFLGKNRTQNGLCRFIALFHFGISPWSVISRYQNTAIGDQKIEVAGRSVEEALHTTLLETGKALILTTVFLFFGFLVLLFSQHPTSVIIGVLTSITLFAGMVTELMLAPVLVRWLLKDF